MYGLVRKHRDIQQYGTTFPPTHQLESLLGLVSFPNTFKQGGNISLLGLAMIGGDYLYSPFFLSSHVFFLRLGWLIKKESVYV